MLRSVLVTARGPARTGAVFSRARCLGSTASFSSISCGAAAGTETGAPSAGWAGGTGDVDGDSGI
ncbi:hypothetical protein AZA_86736 [Nitrospirillum viridazoti Y2]|nr:hypothetical protein AZA_86736 [Nitrospirillum amazonense Y2]